MSNLLQPLTMTDTSSIDFKGDKLNYDKVGELLTLLWTKMEAKGHNVVDIKKVYSIVTEFLENIYKHSDFVEDGQEIVLFKVREKGSNAYIISVQNPVLKEKVEKLSCKIDFINSLNKAGLKKLYQYEIKKRTISPKGGAGLGLIIVARKTENPIYFEAKEYNEFTSLITISVIVSLDE